MLVFFLFPDKTREGGEKKEKETSTMNYHRAGTDLFFLKMQIAH